MALITLECVNCGDNMHVDDGKQKAFCSSCGAENLITQDVINVNNTYNQTTNIGVQNVTQNITNKLGKDIDELIKDGNAFLMLCGDDALSENYVRARKTFEKAIEIAPTDYRGWLGMIQVETLNFSFFNEYTSASSGLPGFSRYLDGAVKVATSEQKKEIIKNVCFGVSNGVVTRYIGNYYQNDDFFAGSFEEAVVIPDEITEIQSMRGPYNGTNFLESVAIPNSVTKIKKYAFYKCYVQNLVIPDSVIWIDEEAFPEWHKRLTISINKAQSKQWNKKWDKNCKAKIVYR